MPQILVGPLTEAGAATAFVNAIVLDPLVAHVFLAATDIVPEATAP